MVDAPAVAVAPVAGGRGDGVALGPGRVGQPCARAIQVRPAGREYPAAEKELAQETNKREILNFY